MDDQSLRDELLKLSPAAVADALAAIDKAADPADAWHGWRGLEHLPQTTVEVRELLQIARLYVLRRAPTLQAHGDLEVLVAQNVARGKAELLAVVSRWFDGTAHASKPQGAVLSAPQASQSGRRAATVTFISGPVPAKRYDHLTFGTDSNDSYWLYSALSADGAPDSESRDAIPKRNIQSVAFEPLTGNTRVLSTTLTLVNGEVIQGYSHRSSGVSAYDNTLPDPFRHDFSRLSRIVFD